MCTHVLVACIIHVYARIQHTLADMSVLVLLVVLVLVQGEERIVRKPAFSFVSKFLDI